MRVNGPDGLSIEFPDDTDPETIDRVMSEALAERQTSANQPSAIQRWLAPVMQGATLGTADEIRGAARAGARRLFGDGDRSFGDLYQEEVGQARDTLEQQRQDHPIASIGSEIGGALAPAMLTRGASLIPRAATTAGRVGAGALEGAGLGFLYGAGASEGGAQDRAEGGMWSAPLGAVAGGVGGRLASGALRGNAMPTIDAVRAARNAAYKTVEDMGATYTPRDVNGLLDRIASVAKGKYLNPARHPKAASMLQEMDQIYRDRGVMLTDLDQLRQIIRRDVVSAADEAEQFFGDLMVDEIDNFIQRAVPSMAGTGGALGRSAADAITQARSLHGALRRAEVIEDAITRAVRRAQSTGSGGNVENAIRQNIRSILDSPSRIRGFTGEEKALMEQIVSGTRGQDFLRLVGRLSPTSGGLMAALNLGAASVNPAMLGVSAVGYGAKRLSDNATIGRAGQLQQLIRSNAPPPPPPTSLAPAERAATALSLGVGLPTGSLIERQRRAGGGGGY